MKTSTKSPSSSLNSIVLHIIFAKKLALDHISVPAKDHQYKHSFGLVWCRKVKLPSLQLNWYSSTRHQLSCSNVHFFCGALLSQSQPTTWSIPNENFNDWSQISFGLHWYSTVRGTRKSARRAARRQANVIVLKSIIRTRGGALCSSKSYHRNIATLLSYSFTSAPLQLLSAIRDHMTTTLL